MRVHALAAFLLGCNVEALGGDTGGVARGDGGVCPDGAVVVLSDYGSSQVALTSVEGVTLSESFVSTASRQADGLAFALSGDTIVPGLRPPSGRVVLIDRFGTNVLTWLDPTTAEVLAQLPIGTGFESNPQDYIEIDATRAYVSRLGHNLLAGIEPFDEGSDLLIVDTRKPAIVGRIPMPSDSEVPARPTGFERLGPNEIVVTLTRLELGFQRGEDSMLVGVDTTTDMPSFELLLEGAKNCGSARRSPSGTLLAVACSGLVTKDGESQGLESSGVLLFDAGERPPRLLQRFGAESFGGEPVQYEFAFASEAFLLLKTQTPVGGATQNRLLSLELASGRVETLVESGSAGDGLTLGTVTCDPGCSNYCLVADAAAGVLQRLRLRDDGAPEYLDRVTVEERIGLPPRRIAYR